MEVIVSLLFFAFVVWYVVRTIQATIETDRERKRAQENKKAAELAEQQKREDEQNYLRNTRLAGEKESARFYSECYKDGAKDMVSAADKERIYLYAKKKNIAGSKEELVNAYSVGQRIVEKENAQKWAEIENHNMEDMIKYVNYHGRDKLLQYLRDDITYYKKENDALSEAYRQATKAGDMLYLASKQKETDWAIAGGIANGLAGPAAGIATAIDVQQKNAAVKASNAALYNTISQYTSMSTDSMIKSMVRYDEHIKDAEDSLSKIQSCLVEEADRNNLFKKLDCSVAKAEISRSGAARISISIKQPKDLKIYKNVPALIDGVLKATIYANDGKKELGSITFGIPYYELKFGGEERSFPVYWRGEHIPTNFTAEVSAVDLWAIEDWRKK